MFTVAAYDTGGISQNSSMTMTSYDTRSLQTRRDFNQVRFCIISGFIKHHCAYQTLITFSFLYSNEDM